MYTKNGEVELIVHIQTIRKTCSCNEYPFFLIFDPKHTLWVHVSGEAVLTCTHNVCFEQKCSRNLKFANKKIFSSEKKISVYCMGMFL